MESMTIDGATMLGMGIIVIAGTFWFLKVLRDAEDERVEKFKKWKEDNDVE